MRSFQIHDDWSSSPIFQDMSDFDDIELEDDLLTKATYFRFLLKITKTAYLKKIRAHLETKYPQLKLTNDDIYDFLLTRAHNPISSEDAEKQLIPYWLQFLPLNKIQYLLVVAKRGQALYFAGPPGGAQPIEVDEVLVEQVKIALAVRSNKGQIDGVEFNADEQFDVDERDDDVPRQAPAEHHALLPHFGDFPELIDNDIDYNAEGGHPDALQPASFWQKLCNCIIWPFLMLYALLTWPIRMCCALFTNPPEVAPPRVLPPRLPAPPILDRIRERDVRRDLAPAGFLERRERELVQERQERKVAQRLRELEIEGREREKQLIARQRQLEKWENELQYRQQEQQRQQQTQGFFYRAYGAAQELYSQASYSNVGGS